MSRIQVRRPPWYSINIISCRIRYDDIVYFTCQSILSI